MQSLGSSGRSPRIPTIAATQKWPQNLYSNYVIVLLFSVNLVKEETGKKASPTTRPNSWATRPTTRVPKESLTSLIIANGNETGLFLSLLPLSV